LGPDPCRLNGGLLGSRHAPFRNCQTERPTADVRGFDRHGAKLAAVIQSHLVDIIVKAIGQPRDVLIGGSIQVDDLMLVAMPFEKLSIVLNVAGKSAPSCSLKLKSASRPAEFPCCRRCLNGCARRNHSQQQQAGADQQIG